MFYLCVYLCTFVCLYAYVCGCSQPEEAVGFPGAGVVGYCKSPNKGIGKQTLVLYKSHFPSSSM